MNFKLDKNLDHVFLVAEEDYKDFETEDTLREELKKKYLKIETELFLFKDFLELIPALTELKSDVCLNEVRFPKL